MSVASTLLRAAVLASSVTLLAGYVIYSHVTPNSPPPDPLGIRGIDLTLEPEVIEFDGFIDYGTPLPPKKISGEDLRIITSKTISQPIFSMKRGGEAQTPSKAFWARLFRSTPVKEQRVDRASYQQEIRIISSKVINQPLFSARTIHWGFIESPEATETADPFAAKPQPQPRFPPRNERVGTWLSSYEMTGMTLDPLRRPASDRP